MDRTNTLTRKDLVQHPGGIRMQLASGELIWPTIVPAPAYGPFGYRILLPNCAWSQVLNINQLTWEVVAAFAQSEGYNVIGIEDACQAYLKALSSGSSPTLTRPRVISRR